MKLLDYCWFESQIFTEQPNLTKPSSFEANQENEIREKPSEPEISHIRTRKRPTRSTTTLNRNPQPHQSMSLSSTRERDSKPCHRHQLGRSASGSPWCGGYGFWVWRENEDSREITREREKERERELILTCLIKSRRERIKYYYLSSELCYSAILKVELHCNTIAKKFAIVKF